MVYQRGSSNNIRVHGNLYIKNKLNIIIILNTLINTSYICCNQYIYFDMPPEITPSPCAKCVCGSRLPMSNKLNLHIGKTCCMLVCSQQKRMHIGDTNLNLSLKCQDIEQVESFKYIGVTIDQNLTYNVHVENVINKISKSLGVLKDLKAS